MKIVTSVKFDGHAIPVWDNINEPLFKAADIARLIDYSCGKSAQMLELVESHQKEIKTYEYHGKICSKWFITEQGLYSLLLQSSKPMAKKWYTLIYEELRRIRRMINNDIMQQFSEWDMMVEGLYFDEDTGMLMQSVTLPGGDADVVPYMPGYTAYFNVETNHIERRKNE